MPTKRGGASRAAASKWTREELVVLFDCLRSEEFMGEHAPSLPRGLFPVIASREAGDKTTEKHALCTAISQEILRAAGEANVYMLRPATSIATKILTMRSQVAHLPPEQALAAFDIDVQQLAIELLNLHARNATSFSPFLHPCVPPPYPPYLSLLPHTSSLLSF